MNNVLAFSSESGLAAAYMGNKEVVDACIQAAVEHAARAMGESNFVAAICSREPVQDRLAA